MFINHFKNQIIFLFIATLFACSLSTIFTEPEQQTINNLVNKSQQPPGIFKVFWSQTDTNGEQVSSGNYTARLTTDRLTDENSINTTFDISTTAPHVPFQNDSLPGYSSLPRDFSISVNSEIYALGDTVIITYELPTSDSNIIIDIEK